MRIAVEYSMAEYDDRFTDNVAGNYYVDDQCIDCDLCRERAPEIFLRNDDEAHSYVGRQPTTDEERLLCEDALDSCPAEAIGNDGPAVENSSIPAVGIDEKNRCSPAGFVQQ